MNVKKLAEKELHGLKIAVTKLKAIERDCIEYPGDEITKVKIIEIISDEVLQCQKLMETLEKKVRGRK